MSRKGARENLIGKKYNHLLVLSCAGTENGRTYWNCLCDCGNIKRILGSSLKSGNTKACGCHQKDGWKNGKTHGKSRTRLYRAWQNMKNRCFNPHDQYYKNYGERGISVCDEWKDNFENFMTWANKNGYSDELTLDRIDNNKGYFPQNCRWADRFCQMNNTRSNRIIEYDGRKQTLTEWSRELGFPTYILSSRLNKYGWSVNKAMETPIQKAGRMHK